MSLIAPAGWHVRGAITGSLFGFPDPDDPTNTIADFFLSPIDVEAIGLTDFIPLVGESLPGLRQVLKDLPEDFSGFAGYSEVTKKVLLHFQFYTKYKVFCF
jgi:hypothetical protein